MGAATARDKNKQPEVCDLPAVADLETYDR